MSYVGARAAGMAMGLESPVEAKRARPRAVSGLLPQPASDFDGVAVMLMPQDDDAADIKPYAAVEQEDLHCTLVFLGDAAKLKERGYTVQSLVAALSGLQQDFEPIEATLGGLTRFSAPVNDPLVLNVDSKQVIEARARVVELLGYIGLAEDTDHGYTPHMTLGYLPHSRDLRTARWTPKPVVFDRVRIGFGGQNVDIELGRQFKGVRRVRTPAGVAKYGQPIGSIIGTDAAPDYELDLGLPDPMANATDADRSRLERRIPARDAIKELQAVQREFAALQELEEASDHNDWRETSDRWDKFSKQHGVTVESSYKSLAENVAGDGSWVQWNACRNIRRAAWDALGYQSTTPEHTTSDPSLLRLTENSWDHQSNATLEAMILLNGVHTADPASQTMYRGVQVSDPDEFLSKLREGTTFDLPLASFTDARAHAERFGTDVTFVLQKGAKGVHGGSMGPPPGMDEDHPDFYDYFEDDESNFEFVSGGRFRIMRTYIKDVNGEPRHTVVIRQIGTFDPANGTVQQKGLHMVGTPWFDWAFDAPLAQPPVDGAKAVKLQCATCKHEYFTDDMDNPTCPKCKPEAKAFVRTEAGSMKYGQDIGEEIEADETGTQHRRRASKRDKDPQTVREYKQMFNKVDTDLWGGGDISISHEMPDGRRVWIYGDTLSAKNGMVRNSALVQKDGVLTPSRGGKQLLPNGGKDPADPSRSIIYWPDSVKQGPTKDTLIITSMEMSVGPPGNPWDFKIKNEGMSRAAIVKVDAKGNMKFKRWKNYVPTPMENNPHAAADLIDHGNGHVSYGTVTHDIRLKDGSYLTTRSHNHTDALENHVGPKGFNWHDYRPTFGSTREKP